ncbi:hypothetical protein NDU88_001524 [Pleurodeles waltl]|uniref:Uncharacterized protein n=1 Tax=Pleurodeles waltl TaxID=8319 RepID=A0AAV7LYV0_PLEWA|nr:hypothetical protein NDU88_001524 [Pleurodeles waltl]
MQDADTGPLSLLLMGPSGWRPPHFATLNKQTIIFLALRVTDGGLRGQRSPRLPSATGAWGPQREGAEECGAEKQLCPHAKKHPGLLSNKNTTQKQGRPGRRGFIEFGGPGGKPLRKYPFLMPGVELIYREVSVHAASQCNVAHESRENVCVVGPQCVQHPSAVDPHESPVNGSVVGPQCVQHPSAVAPHESPVNASVVGPQCVQHPSAMIPRESPVNASVVGPQCVQHHSALVPRESPVKVLVVRYECMQHPSAMVTHKCPVNVLIVGHQCMQHPSAIVPRESPENVLTVHAASQCNGPS